MDLHIHTPASVDYQDPRATPLDILRRAEEAGLDILAFTDHNSVRGYADMWREIEDLELLEFLKRIHPNEQERLAEYRRLLRRILVLPGFEFTATFGFHVLAVFPEGTSVRLMEHLLLSLGVPEDRFGSGEVGATSDVLKAYELLAEHGALVIGAHVNSTHGVAMQGLKFGGQTKIAYTQHENLHALEVTDLGLGQHRRSTARFFNGSKPEYPRRMHCIQGSDAHRLLRDLERETQLGIGDRATEVLLPEVSFRALKDLFASEEFDRTRPFLPAPADPVKAARLDGNTAVQAFHESLSTKRTGISHLLRDIVAFANSDGGTVIVGASAAEKRPVHGVADPDAAIAEITAEAATQITPPATFEIETVLSDGKPVLMIAVAEGTQKPHALAPGSILVRRGAETDTATRDEIVAMVTGARPAVSPALPPAPAPAAKPARVAPEPRPAASRPEPEPASASANGALPEEAAPAEAPKPEKAPRARAAKAPKEPRKAAEEAVAAPAPKRQRAPRASAAAAPVEPPEIEETPIAPDPDAPTTGVEVVDRRQEGGQTYYTLHDLKASSIVSNVTRNADRRMWRSAISQHEEQAVDESKVTWQGDRGLWRTYRPRGGERRYHLVLRTDDGLRVFYGVSEAGMTGPWEAFRTRTTAGSGGGGR